MNKDFLYFIAGGVIAYFLFNSKKSKVTTPNPEPEKGDADDNVTGVNDVIKNSRNFEFAYEDERNAFNKQYDIQYPVGSSPANGDLVSISWKIPDQNYSRRSTFQYFDRYWRRFANPMRPKPKVQRELIYGNAEPIK
jgi:hypothetical protein